MIKRNSLSVRLIGAASVVSVVLLIAAGLLLSNLFTSAVERSLDARLQAVMDGLLASVELDGAKPKMASLWKSQQDYDPQRGQEQLAATN